MIEFPDQTKRKIPISAEFDNMLSAFYVAPRPGEKPRSTWDQIIAQKRPEIVKFEEQVDPVRRCVKLCNLYLPQNRYLSQKTMISLISQHFRILGLVKSQEMLQNETLVELEIPSHLKSSKLTFLVQRGILHSERFWDLYNSQDTRLFDEEIMHILGIVQNGIEDDAPIEDEIVPDPNLIATDENNNLTQATLNQLILILTSNTPIGTRLISSAFCLAFKSVVTCDKLFIKFRDRFRMCIRDQDKEGLMLTRDLFTEWLHKGQGEIESATVEAARHFANKELASCFDVSSLFPSQTSSFKYTVASEKAPKVMLGDVGISLWTGDFSLTSLPAKELARQITYMCSTRFYAIQRSELLNVESPHRAPNVTALITVGNELGCWAAGEILMGKTVEDRISKMKFFVEVARQLWDICNFFGAYAVSGAFSNNAVFRLTAHLSLLPKADTKFIKDLNAHLGEASYTYLREMQITENVTKPVLPLFSIVLQDLKRQNETQKTKIGDKINILKFTCTHKIISDLIMFQFKKYNFLPITQVQQKLETLNAPDNSWLMTISTEIEPQNATVETIRMLDSQ